LDRECQSSGSTRKRKKKVNTLEAKVDGILSLLQAVNEPTKVGNGNALAFRAGANATVHEPGAFGSHTTHDGEQDFLGAAISQNSTPSSFTGVSNNNNVTPAASDFSRNANEYLSSSSYSGIGPSFEEAEQYLTDFCAQKLIHFAFIYLPRTTTIKQLQQERPFLFLTIMAVSAKSGTQRLALGHEIKHLLLRELVFNPEGNLDLLLGMLVLITWYSSCNNPTNQSKVLC
jgi:hypothetical protein